jgi:hypothetical protein
MIAAVRAMIEARVRDWITGLPADPAHPFLRRNTGRFAFSGSWSVRLRSAGFHENHIHPEGWISACYYVALPRAVDFHRQGWLKFGETGLRLGERERITPHGPARARPSRAVPLLFLPRNGAVRGSRPPHHHRLRHRSRVTAHAQLQEDRP